MIPVDTLRWRGDKAVLEIVLPLPPSDNHIYETRRRGRKSFRALTPEAEHYQQAVKSDVSGLALKANVTFNPDSWYLLVLNIVFEAIENEGWHKKKRTAQSRIKKIDLTNRNKLLLDSIAKSVGIDDSSSITVVLLKDENPDDPRVEVKLMEVSDQEIVVLKEALHEAVERVLWPRR